MSSQESAINQGAIGTEAAKAQFGPPQFDDPAAEQTFIKTRLAAAFRLFAYYGFDDGLAGHITARDSLDPETFWVNPLGIHFAQLKASDLVRMNHAGEIVEGQALVNTAAFMIHAAIHQAKPEINAVAHAHSKYGKAWSTQGRLLEPLTQDACLFYQAHSVFSHFSGVVHEQSEGQAIVAAMNPDDVAVILQNHGLLTVGKDVDSAVSLFVQLERACENQLLVEQLPNKQLIPEQVAKKTREFIGSNLVVWGSFQPLYQMIEMLDDSFKA
ncbi:class II aldolase/adducin family protein [Marinicella sp. S1101]|uniref:class II aldolase/adducin family protein n=1 Tax=Marinicella marina TaxID=2996016 RepID=UPI0022609A3A|nr:class II aldolase/adducin family protein [Marinicella marina]MCX7554053.1 class II aldolase/adducin family protein [Marinicella marina]MDJ1140545.1 class II aldolase/adducin family protein [Marinicella marina]